MRSLLLISPYFPPMRRVGARRALHFARALPQWGWRPVVLTAPVVEDATDPLLEAAIPPETVVHHGYAGPMRRAKHWLPARSSSTHQTTLHDRPALDPRKYLGPFDRYVWDIPWVLGTAAKLIEEHDIEAIVACGDPFTVLYAGALLKARTGLPFVADLRDPFALNELRMAVRPRPTRALIHRLEAAVFSRADRIVLNTEAACHQYREHYQGRISPEAFTYIRNGFDKSLYTMGAPHHFDRFTVLYFGGVRPFVTLDNFLPGFARFVERRGLTPGQAQVLLMGAVDAYSQHSAERLGVGDYLRAAARISVVEAMPLLKGADLLVAILASKTQIPAKLYDYLASGSRVLALPHSAEVAAILSATGAGTTASTEAEVAEALDRAYDARGQQPQVVADALTRYSAASTSHQLADVLESVVDP